MGMPFNWIVALFLLVAAVVIVLLIRMATQARHSAETPASEESPAERQLLRFVVDESGTRLGETVAVEGDDFIVKDAKGFLAVPTAQVHEDGKDLRLKGSLDESEARIKGEAWRERSHKVITYSESEIPKDEPTE